MRLEKGTVILSEEEFHEMDEDLMGVCLACGETQGGCEPDARKYICESCGDDEVYGVQELLMMNRLSLE